MIGKRFQREERESGNGTPVSVSLSKRACFGVRRASEDFEPVTEKQEEVDENTISDGAQYNFSQRFHCASPLLQDDERRLSLTTMLDFESATVNSLKNEIVSQASEGSDDGTFLLLPEDLVLHTLSFLGAPELFRVMQVSKHLSSLCHKEYLWRRLTLLDYRRDLIFFQSHYSLLLFLTGWKGFYKAISTMQIDLDFLSGPRANSAQTIPKRAVALGRSRSNDVCILQDEMISRRHAVISYHHNKLWLRDVGGINGTYLNDFCLPQHVDFPLHLGDVVELGASSFTVRPHITIDLPRQPSLPMLMPLQLPTTLTEDTLSADHLSQSQQHFHFFMSMLS